MISNLKVEDMEAGVLFLMDSCGSIPSGMSGNIGVWLGICSSDVDDEFDSRSFTDGFAGKMKKKVEEWVDGIH